MAQATHCLNRILECVASPATAFAFCAAPGGLSGRQQPHSNGSSGPIGNVAWPKSVNAAHQDVSLLLSWVESGSGGCALKYATRRRNTMPEVRIVVAGKNLWRHPAELSSASDGTMPAHLVEEGEDSTDAGEILVSSSRDEEIRERDLDSDAGTAFGKAAVISSRDAQGYRLALKSISSHPPECREPYYKWLRDRV